MTVAKTVLDDAWKVLNEAIMYYQGRPIGTRAAIESSDNIINYNQCFTRDFAVCGLAFLLRGETAIVRHFLTALVELQTQEKHMDCFRAGQGLMPASFSIHQQQDQDVLVPDFGEQAIARVAPVDAVFWWLILLRAYTQASGDNTLAQQAEFQQAIRLIIELCLTTGFSLYPTLLVPDGAYMIDRRMGVYGYPFDIQVLFFYALLAARELLHPQDPYIDTITHRLRLLTHYLHQYYWLDFPRLNQLYRHKVEEYGAQAMNKFNIYPDTIPTWLMQWLSYQSGYFVGNVGPGRMDFRFFAQGNLLAIVTGLATSRQTEAILDLFQQRWTDLIGDMPVKLCFPALEGRDWEVLTGYDHKNRPWSYHNGGNWPFLLWLLAAAAQKAGVPELAQQALKSAERRLVRDQWPEYYDSHYGRLIGREAKRGQTWTAAGFLVAHQLLQQPEQLKLIQIDAEDIFEKPF